MTTLDVLRRFYGQLVTRSAGVHDPRIADAFATVERERFVGPGPWQIKVLDGYLATGSDDPAVLYQDILVGLVPEEGLNNGEPSLHARCIGAAAPQPGEWYVCYPGGFVPVENVVGQRSSTDFGMDFGGGVKFGAIYAEIRYHYIWGPTVPETGPTQPLPGVSAERKANGQFLQTTFGIRF